MGAIRGNINVDLTEVLPGSEGVPAEQPLTCTNAVIARRSPESTGRQRGNLKKGIHRINTRLLRRFASRKD